MLNSFTLSLSKEEEGRRGRTASFCFFFSVSVVVFSLSLFSLSLFFSISLFASSVVFLFISHGLLSPSFCFFSVSVSLLLFGLCLILSVFFFSLSLFSCLVYVSLYLFLFLWPLNLLMFPFLDANSKEKDGRQRRSASDEENEPARPHQTRLNASQRGQLHPPLLRPTPSYSARCYHIQVSSVDNFPVEYYVCDGYLIGRAFLFLFLLPIISCVGT